MAKLPLKLRFWILIFGFGISALAGCGVENKISSILISPSSKTIGLGKTQQFYAMAFDSRNTVLSSISYTWSADASIGTINSSGLLTAASSVSTGYVRATAEGITGTALVTITDKGTISGRVRNQQGTSIANMLVFLTEIPTFSAFTNTSGDYSVEDVPYGTFEVQARENSLYLHSTSDAFVATGETTTVNFTLADRLSVENENISGDPITISGSARNHGTTEAKSVSISYLFYDANGALSSSASQTLGNISAGAAQLFYLVPSPPISSYTTVKKTLAATSF